MKSFKDYIAEEHPTWHVTFKTGHKPQKVKGRNTAEAIKKAEKRAQKSGEKDPRQLAMYKGIKKVSEETEIDEATAMTAAPKGSLGGSRPQNKYNAPKGTAKHHADMAAKHQQASQSHADKAADHEDAGNDNKADHHYDKSQYHDNAADAHNHAQSMIKKHGADHPEAQKASQAANKHKLDEAQLDEISKDTLKRYADSAASDARWHWHKSQTSKRIHNKTREKHFTNYAKRRKGVGSAMKRGVGTDHHVDQIAGHDNYGYSDKGNPNKGDKVKKWKKDQISRMPKRNSMTDKPAPYKHESVELSEADIAEILRQYALSENINADQLANLTEEEINEIIGKAIGGAFKLGAKAAVGAGRLAAKGAKKALFNKQGNRRGSMAAKNDKLQAKKDKIQQDRRDLVKNRKLERDVERAQKKLDRSKAAAKKY